jgi:O-methyltransferase involved in polyketide biosynthesis
LTTATVPTRLTGVPETLLMTLRAKALDARAPRPILGDALAAEWMAALDYDFGKLAGFGEEIIAARASRFDDWTREFLGAHPRAVVLNLGCGLDTRYFRIGPPSDALWFDVDYPEVLAIRRRLCAEREGYRMLDGSVTDPGWLDAIPTDRPAWILAEGLLEYLEEAEVEALLNRLTSRFASGGIAFDVMNAFAVRSARDSLEKTTGAHHKWAVDHPRDADRLDARMRRREALSVFAAPGLRRLPAGRRLLYAVLRFAPLLRGMMRLLRYEF